MAEKPLKGTTTVGIVCKNGIVLAADKRATAGYIANKRAKKIHKITDNMAVTMAGLVSDAQLLVKLIRAELKLKDLHTNRTSQVKEAANLLAGMLYSNLRKMSMVPGIVAFLLGGHDNTGNYLYDLGIDGSVTDIIDYVSDGSGSVFALGVLEALYKKNMSVDDGIKLAVKAINAALQRDPATGNGIDIVVVDNKGVTTILEKELNIKLEV
ncbi:proteasome subunit beta [Candidatus Woesearchaeota archaeon]|nr:MAG: proteasome subunit beta [Candidatus Woesearchaeota archaeon ex4484_78]RLE45536.1 MAG: proteasome subunit beta [Candidatus Woesearchaeota archaeon]